jgi:ubiquinone/menaquinone biosynthesis C-methylase UbiE
MEIDETSKSASGWLGYMKRTILGRSKWQAQKEFSYYKADLATVQDHRARQVALERRVFAPGIRIAAALGVLDSELLREARVLDLGAGECWLAQGIGVLAGASEVWATDAVPKQIWAAAARHAAHPILRFLVADACDLPFEAEQFDLVVGNLVLHHIHPLEDALSEAFRVLSPGGLFAAFEPNPFLGALVHEKTSENEAPVVPGAVLRAAARVGFTDLRRDYWWSRLETSKLGPLSPGYRIHARKHGHLPAMKSTVSLRRPLQPMRLPGLLIDSACKFAELANAQADQIAGYATA